MSPPQKGQPRDPGVVGPVALIGIMAFGFIIVVATWAAAGAASGEGHTPPALGDTLGLIFHGDLAALIGASGNKLLFWLVMAGCLGPLVGIGLFIGIKLLNRIDRRGTAIGSMAGVKNYDDMAGKGAVQRARQLRPGLKKSQTINGGDIGLRVGRLNGTDLYASHEDVLLEICGPRSNKTSALVVPSILGAPGPVITTSNKVDVWTLTSALRAQVGRLFVFDPQQIARVPQTWWWNPLRSIRDMSDAGMLAVHFMADVGGESEQADPYFTKGAQRLLCQHFLAGALGGRTLRDVIGWIATRSEEPVALLREHGMPDIAQGLAATLEAPSDQRGGLYETAMTGLGCLESEGVARYVSPPSSWRQPPPPDVEIIEFDPWHFIAGYGRDANGVPSPTDTLYLFTKEGAGTGAPVCAALVDRMLKTASEAAAARGGRIEPPVRAVLDEAANICPIKDLPDLYSYFGSQSIQTVCILQSREQGNHVWTKTGMAKLWAAATVKLVGAGVHDPEFCEDVSRLIGDHDVDTVSVSRGGGQPSRSYSTRQERIMTAADVAALTKTQAILIASGKRPALIELLPWYREDDAKTISQYSNEASDEVRRAAVEALGVENPVGQAIASEINMAGARK